LPKEVYTVSPIVDLSIESINRLVTDLNQVLARLSDEVATIEGLEGRKPSFNNFLNLNGNRICHVGRTINDGDVPSRRELVDRALYVRSDTKKHQTDKVIVAKKGIEVPFADQPGMAPNLSQLKEEIGGVLPQGLDTTDSPTFVVLTLTNGQLVFPGTAVPSAGVNTLDDYEEGTFTPVATFSGGSGTITYTTQDGAYTKIGNRVFFSITLETLSIASRTGSLTIAGLPFTVNATHRGGVSVGFASGLAITAGQVVTGVLNNGATTMSVQLWDATTGTTAIQDTEWTDDGRVFLSGHYII